MYKCDSTPQKNSNTETSIVWGTIGVLIEYRYKKIQFDGNKQSSGNFAHTKIHTSNINVSTLHEY